MAEEIRGAAPPSRTEGLQFVCPRCRAPLDVEQAADRCSSCGFATSRIDGIVSFVADGSAEEWRKFWESKAAAADGATSAGDAYTFSIQHRYIVDAFHTLCREVPTSARVLDVGCGNALFWKSLFAELPVVGVDYSLGMCRRARARGMEVYHADAMALPFADAQFDLVYSAEILQCVDDLPAFLTELARVCRPGGRIIVSTLNRLSLIRSALGVYKRIFPPHTLPTHNTLIMRTAKEMAAAGSIAHLRLGTICRTHFPVPWRYSSTNTRYIFEPLASNMIVEFIKPAH